MKAAKFKRLTSFFLCLLLCMIISMPAMATTKPALEIMQFNMDMNSVGGVSVEFSFRNNSGKSIKYIDVTVSAYNRVGDRAYDEIRGTSSSTLTVIGPFNSFTLLPKVEAEYSDSSGKGTPFEKYAFSPYLINDSDGDPMDVYYDKNGNYYVKPKYDINTYTYLSDYEISNIMYTDNSVEFENVFYNSSIDYLMVDKVVVTFMDGTKTTISGNNAISKDRYYTLQNQPFLPTVARYSAVYNYNDYKTLNPDLVAALGDNEKLLFEHFINNGMKEGRQGSVEFNLAAYKANNSDLAAAYGEDNVKYYEHFISFGKAEGRTAV